MKDKKAETHTIRDIFDATLYSAIGNALHPKEMLDSIVLSASAYINGPESKLFEGTLMNYATQGSNPVERLAYGLLMSSGYVGKENKYHKFLLGGGTFMAAAEGIANGRSLEDILYTGAAMALSYGAGKWIGNTLDYVEDRIKNSRKTQGAGI